MSGCDTPTHRARASASVARRGEAGRPIKGADRTQTSPFRRSAPCGRQPLDVTVVGWDGCDRIGPVHEGDSLDSTVTVESTHPLPGSGSILWLGVGVNARSGDSDEPRPVLRWRCAVVMA
ncbi:hypothetical protein GCM10009753_03660 [Streptantibioticus ferralitis]